MGKYKKIVIGICFLISILSIFMEVVKRTDMFSYSIFASVEGVATFFLFFAPVIILNIVLFIFALCKFNDITKVVLLLILMFIINSFAVFMGIDTQIIEILVFCVVTVLADIFLILYFFFKLIRKNYEISSKVETIVTTLLIFMIFLLIVVFEY